MSPWRQRFKWTVYALLFVDFILYLVQDIEYAHYVLDAKSDLLEILAAYVTSIDLVAWFALILLFELETYVLVDRDWTGLTKWLVQGVRLVCYVAILHTSFSYDIALSEFHHPRNLPAAADVCAYTGDWSFLRNRDYIDITADNCRTIGKGPEFFALSDDAVLTDRAGLAEGTILAWTDLVESVAWLLIVFATEAIVRLQHAGSRSDGAALATRTRQDRALRAHTRDRRVLGLQGPGPVLLGRDRLGARIPDHRLEHPRLADVPARAQRFDVSRLAFFALARGWSLCSVISDSMRPSSALEQTPRTSASSCPFGAT